jgi:hypothetical protein
LTAPAVLGFWSALHPWRLWPWWIPAWHAVLRYGDVVATGMNEFAVQDSLSDLPSRHKQLVSEELAIGYCGYVLREVFGVQHIADAESLIGGQLQRVARGGKQCPDYFCRRPDGTVVIAEAKGTLGDLRALAPRLRKGKRQVGAVTPVGTSVHARVVIGLGLALERERRPSIAAIHDPQEEHPIPVEVSAEGLVRQAYAKVFLFLGLPFHAGHVAQVPPEDQGGLHEERAMLRLGTVGNVRIMMLDFPPFPEVAIGIAESVYEVLIQDAQGLHERVSSALAELAPREDEGLIVLNNGLVVIHR